MHSSHPWLFSHLGAGLLLSLVLLLLLGAMRHASTAQRCWMTVIFLAAMSLVTPWQGRWWPDVRIPLPQAVKEAVPGVETLSTTMEMPHLGRPARVEEQGIDLSQQVVAPAPLWQALLLPMWALGVGIVLLRLLMGAWLWRRLWANGQTASLPLPPGSPRADIRFSSAIAGPMAAGREILLPSAWTQWPSGEQNAALAHELAHVRHRDSLSRWVAEAAAALHWPSPFVWLMRRELRLAQEQRCDEAVLAAGVDATVYGRLLLRCAREHAARRGSFGLPLTAASMARPGQLTRRLRHLATGPTPVPATPLRHLVWPLIIACICLQGLHVRLVAEPVKKPAGDSETHDKARVALEVRFIESTSEVARNAVETAGVKEGTSTRRLTEKQSTRLLRQMLTLETTQVTAYPRMVTLPGREVLIRSVVATEEAPLTFERLGKTGAYCVGTLLSLTPQIEAGSHVKLAGALGINSGIRQLPENLWEHDGQHADIDTRLAAGESLILGPLKPVEREAGKRKDVWVILTPAILASKEETQKASAEALRTARPKIYDLKPQSIDRVLARLASDADLPFWMLSPSKPGQQVSLGVTMAPFAAMESLCEKLGLQLRLRDGIWTAGTQEQWSHAPEERPANLTTERTRLSVQPAQTYDFFQAGLADVMRFLATDSSINFISLPETSPKNDHLLTFHMHASPFTLMEKICEMNGLHLVQHNSIWYVTDHAEGEERYHKTPRLTGPEVERLRAVPPKQRYDFHKAVLGDVLRFLIKDAGIPILSLPDDAPSSQKLVTFSIESTPFSVLEALCHSFNLVLLPKDDTWFIRESP